MTVGKKKSTRILARVARLIAENNAAIARELKILDRRFVETGFYRQSRKLKSLKERATYLESRFEWQAKIAGCGTSLVRARRRQVIPSARLR